MKNTHNKKIVLKATRYLMYCLILLIFPGCSKNEDSGGTNLRWSDKQAIAVVFPKHLTPGPTAISVRVLEADRKAISISAAISGNTIVQNDSVIFTPVVPFAHGLQYEILAGDEPVAVFSIPKSKKSVH